MTPPSRKLRIAAWYNLPSGGGKRALHDQLKGLRARGHEIVVWRPPLRDLDYLPIAEIAEEREVPLHVEARQRGGKLGDVIEPLEHERATREGLVRHSVAVAKEIEAGGFDVFFASNCEQYHAPWVSRYLSLPKAIYLGEPKRPLHEATTGSVWHALPENGHPNLKGRVRHRYQRLKNDAFVRAQRRIARDEYENARAFDRILVNSNYSRESVLRAYGLDATVCYLGIDTGRFEDRHLPREPFVMSMGVLHVSKGPQFIVRAIGAVPESIRPPLVWVANRVHPDEQARVDALAKELGVDVRIRQSVSEPELLDLMNRATAMVYAPRLEPFGYAPLEGNACGLPAVVVAEGGVRESVRDGVNGVVVPYRPEAMGAAVAGLLTDPVAARALGKRAAENVRTQWSLERAADELERNLIEVAER